MSDYLYEMRIRQWTKNLLVYASPMFGGVLFYIDVLTNTTLAFLSFCLASSGVYFINDIFDLAQDRKNPRKCHRPIAGGRIGVPTAYMAAVALFLGAGCLAASLAPAALALVLSYIVMNLAYTVRLKHMVIIDVMIIAAGFVMRAVMGVIVAHTGMTVWFFLCVLFLSLFLALGKRRHELLEVAESSECEGRKVLRFYTKSLIDQMMTIVTSALVICYALFTVDTQTYNREGMVLTIPLVLYGVFYYLYVVRVKRSGGAPDEALYKEKNILVVVLLYVACIIAMRSI